MKVKAKTVTNAMHGIRRGCFFQIHSSDGYKTNFCLCYQATVRNLPVRTRYGMRTAANALAQNTYRTRMAGVRVNSLFVNYRIDTVIYDSEMNEMKPSWMNEEREAR